MSPKSDEMRSINEHNMQNGTTVNCNNQKAVIDMVFYSKKKLKFPKFSAARCIARLLVVTQIKMYTAIFKLCEKVAKWK